MGETLSKATMENVLPAKKRAKRKADHAATSAAGTFRFALQENPQLICIGDIHEDPLALLKCLLLSEVIDSGQAEEIVPKLKECDPKILSEEKTRTSYKETINWIGENSTVCLLGDVCDFHRVTRLEDGTTGRILKKDCVDLEGNGALTFIFEVLERLKGQAKAQGGDVIWILGNHDIQNVIPFREPGAAWCRHYHGHCTQEGNYTEERKALVQTYMKKLRAVPYVLFREKVFLCHGGVSQSLTRELENFKMRERLPLLKRMYDSVLVADESNYEELGFRSLNKKEESTTVDSFSVESLKEYTRSNLLGGPADLTWCRPGIPYGPPFNPSGPMRVEESLAHVKYLDTQVETVVVAHQPVSSAVCLDSGFVIPEERVDSETVKLGKDRQITASYLNGSLCYTDGAMTRGFGTIQQDNPKSQYRVLKIRVDGKAVEGKFLFSDF